jgi:predicted Zn-dependent peptidase
LNLIFLLKSNFKPCEFLKQNNLNPKISNIKIKIKSSKQVIPKNETSPEPVPVKERHWEGTHPQATSDVLVMGYPIPPIDSPDAVPLSLLGTHLSIGMEARLRKVLVDKGLAVSAYAGPSALPDVFEVFVQLAKGQKAEKALALIDHEIAVLKRTPIAKSSFERALNQELLDIYSDITSNSSLANLLGEYLIYCGNYLRPFELIESFKKTTAADILKAARIHLDSRKRSVIILRPERKA